MKITDLTKDELWNLRQQIVLNSIFTKDYNNDMGIDPQECYTFFDGYVEYLNELAEGDGGVTNVDTYKDYDNADNLYDWALMLCA